MLPGQELRGARRLFFVGVGFAVLIAMGIAGYRILEAMDWFEAFYMTVITISTVGFGEIKPLSSSGRVLTVFLIVGSAGLAAFALTVIGDLVASGEWRAWRENRKRARMLNQLENHVIVCGYGRVGRHVAHALELEHIPFIVLDKDANQVAHIHKTGHLGLHGNAANELTLKQAGIERARGLVAAVDSDAENVFIVLTARVASRFTHYRARELRRLGIEITARRRESFDFAVPHRGAANGVVARAAGGRRLSRPGRARGRSRFFVGASAARAGIIARGAVARAGAVAKPVWDHGAGVSRCEWKLERESRRGDGAVRGRGNHRARYTRANAGVDAIGAGIKRPSRSLARKPGRSFHY